MAENPSVSVIIVTYNSQRWIGPCLDALLTQQTSRSYEIIVHDNGSTDKTREMIRINYPSVRLIEGPNIGFGGGNNRAVKGAYGQILAFINPDTKAEPEWLEALAARTCAGVVTTSKIVLDEDPQRINTCGNDLHFTGYGFTLGFGDASHAHNVCRTVPGISGASFAIRHADFLSLGGFDEDFFLYMEDTELSWRVHRARMRILYVPQSVVHHSYKLTMDAGKLYHVEKGRIMILRKHLVGMEWVKLAPSLLLADVLSWVWALSLGTEGIAQKLRALRDGWFKRVKRYDRLPAIQIQAFANRRMPFTLLLHGRASRAISFAVNAVFLANTLTWRRMF